MMDVDEDDGSSVNNNINHSYTNNSSYNDSNELEDVYMRPVFNELELPDQVSFLPSVSSGNTQSATTAVTTTAKTTSITTAAKTSITTAQKIRTVSDVLIVVDTCVLIAKTDDLKEWMRSTKSGVDSSSGGGGRGLTLFLPWTVLQVR